MQTTNFLKKLMTKASIFSMLLMSFTVPAVASDISLIINDKNIDMPVAPVIESDTTLVPLRIITENMGAKVEFNSSTKTINLTKGNTAISLTIDKQTAIINNKSVSLSLAPKLIDSTTMVPIRFISENFECKVDWVPEKKLISITLPKTGSDSDTSTDLSTQTKKVLGTISIKDYGTLELELYPELAPKTVENFIKLANSKFYDGLTFHRIISSFMIQGGDPTATGTGGPGYTIPGEFAANGYTQNTLRHTKGVISMARTSDPNSAGSQFFIMSGDAPHLDGYYAAFGKVTKGLDLIDKIEKVETKVGDKPVVDVVIESIRFDSK